jgi:hypothetical protein
MPYQHHEATYAVGPAFLWQPLRPEPTYNHPLMRDFWTGWACEAYFEQHSGAAGLTRHLVGKVLTLWGFFVGVSLTPLVGGLWCALRKRWARFALLTCGLLLAALLLESGVMPHYGAPATGLGFCLLTCSLRHTSRWRWRGVAAGRVLASGVVASCVFAAVASVIVAGRMVDPREWFRQRQRIAARLADTPGRHLVVVRYGPGHSAHQEWVYNEADLDGARVVWAREMGPAQDGRLLEYFRDRVVWLLEADAAPPRLVPYPSGSPAGAGARADRSGGH